MNFFRSIRFKFLFLVISLFTIAMGLITGTSRELFLQDKESYLYEDMLTSVENDAHFIQFYIDNQVILSKTLFSNITLKKSENIDARLKFPREFYLDNPTLIDFRLFRYGNKEFLLDDEVRNRSIAEIYETSEELFSSGDKMNTFLAEVVSNKIMQDVYKDKNNIIQLRVGFYDVRNRFVGFFRFALGVHLSKLNFGESYSKILVNNANDEIYSRVSSFDEFSKAKLTISDNIHRYINEQSFKTGVKSLKLNSKPYIIAFHKFAELDLKYLSLISEEQAFSATKVLVIKIFKLAFFLFIFIIILVSFFTRGITDSLRQLITSSNLAIEGNYRNSIKVRSKDEVGRLAISFNEMIGQVQNYTEKLVESNRNLETTVDERTKDLKKSNDFINAVINSLNQGLFVFNEAGRVLPVYTKSCEVFFGTGFSHKNLLNLLPFSSQEEGTLWLKGVFEEMIPFDSLAQLAPKELTPRGEDTDSEDYFYATIEYFPMRDEEGKIQFIVLVATDKTIERKAMLNFEGQKNYVERIVKTAKSKNSFVLFINETKESLKKIKSDFELQKENVFDVNMLMREFHTIKGIASQYSVNNLAEYIHKVEDEVGKFQNSEVAEKKNYLSTLIGHIVHIEKLFEKLITESKEIIGEALLDGKLRDEIPREDLYKFKEFLLSTNVAEQNDPMITLMVNEFGKRFLQMPIKNYFQTFDTLINELAMELGKEVGPIEFIKGSLLVDRTHYRGLFNNFVHIFRNIVDHGIEPAQERKALGKPETGKIKIEFIHRNDRIEMHLSDDGAGIDPEKIKERMKKLNYPSKSFNVSDEKIIHHIFDPNFSTRDDATDISGRGVGMDAVKYEVESMDGVIKVTSVLGKGTTFHFRLPLK